MSRSSIRILFGALIVVIVLGYFMFGRDTDTRLDFKIEGTNYLPYSTCTIGGTEYFLVGPVITIKDESGKVVSAERAEMLDDSCSLQVDVSVSTSDFYTLEVEGTQIGTYPANDLRGGTVYD